MQGVSYIAFLMGNDLGGKKAAIIQIIRQKWSEWKSLVLKIRILQISYKCGCFIWVLRKIERIDRQQKACGESFRIFLNNCML